MSTQPSDATLVVAVHGVTPLPRYQFQDQVAQTLCARMNERDHRKGTANEWTVDVYNPCATPPLGDVAHPTANRIHAKDDTAAAPTSGYIDVREAYWSPLDKHRTTWRSVVGWLLRTMLVPINSTAHYAAPRAKVRFDLCFTGGAIVLALIAGALAAWFGLLGLRNIFVLAASHAIPQKPTLAILVELLTSPASLTHILNYRTIELLVAGAIGGFLFILGLRATVTLVRQRTQAGLFPFQAWSRMRMIVGLLVIGSGLIAVSGWAPLANGRHLHFSALLFLAAFASLEGSRTLLETFLVNFFGDVQIYTTINENATFFALREAMLECVVQRIREAIDDNANDGKPYSRVVIAAHSLGSTIAMDAIIRLFQLKEQGSITPAQFARMRAFVTFGSPMEKTKYFFDVVNPSPSLAYDQWNGDVYGCLFTRDVTVLSRPNGAKTGILWLNYWYCQDPIGGPIESYRSFLLPGDSISSASTHRSAMQAIATASTGKSVIGRRLCRNERGHRHLSPTDPVIHGDYLNDPWFWFCAPGHVGALDILAPAAPGIAAVPTHVPALAPTPLPAPSAVARYQLVDTKAAAQVRDRYD